MKKPLSLLICLFISIDLFAQSVKPDIIITKSNTKVEAIIQEVNKAEIKYKRFSNPTGPVFTIDKAEIASIVYANGDVESFGNIQISVHDIPNLAQIPKNDFEVRILNESDDYLIEVFHREKNYAKNGTVTGIIFTGLAAGCFILGSVSEGQNPNSVSGLKRGLVSGAVIGTFASLIWIRKGKHSSKAKFIEQELVRLNINPNTFSLRIQPSNSALNAPSITFRATF